MCSKIKKLQFISEVKISLKHSWFYAVIIELECPTFQNSRTKISSGQETLKIPKPIHHVPCRFDRSKGSSIREERYYDAASFFEGTFTKT